MSHISKIKTNYKDWKGLKRAIENMGGTVHENTTEFLYFGGSKGKCTHMAEFKGARYQLGITLDEKTGTYNLAMDNYSSGGLSHIVGHNGVKLKVEYSAAVTEIKLERQGFQLKRELKADGGMRLVARD